jgi:hypothetical protein
VSTSKAGKGTAESGDVRVVRGGGSGSEAGGCACFVGWGLQEVFVEQASV